MIKKISYLVLLTGLVLTSCEKDFLDVNQDPSKAASVPANLLLPSAESQIAYAIGGDASRICGVFTQQFTGASRQFAQYQIYSISPTDIDNLWRFNLYGGPLQDLKELEKLSIAKGYTTYSAVSKILLAYTLGVTTDLWGDIPYSNAFKATAQLNPTFDSQESIYNSLQSMLDEAIVLLNGTDASGVTPGDDDLLFAGDVDSWKKFANSLKARFYLHVVKRDAGAAAKILPLIANGLAAGEVAAFNFGVSETSANPFYQFNDQRGDISYSGYLITQMVANGDPRLDEYADTSSGTMGAFYGSINSPVDFMTYSELKFIQAEAAFRTNDLTTAAASLNEAVKSSILRINGSPDSTFEANYASETSGSITLNKIMTQKYFAMYTSSESWTDWRRTGIPNLLPNDGVAIPRSFWYPESEVSFNSNTPPNTSLLRKVWWDN